ncbi:putative SPBc2 prophage-derived single-strand DNA-specific exonuclease [Bacillus phage vB_BcoS-136]|uniref:Putative SPBc2 prophage-derived single-strand DNA-specific exonuclease n=1 Tax=Bacillus phage vB_BcoS-136 TaxID=2419619 RepID=A0A3G3BVQ8_9CAUD|nr:putative SPBc2 prophage-derived single-strand DNA-specific exonuclease [Bacillus phage vB_BcoS-136]AYP68359.1 putative SPBc2 prophage-derived single-strand DNA-specific exonuclease [Bacillus phage vB_BcoS-136]
MKWLQRKAKVTPKKHDNLIDSVAKIRGIDDISRFLNPTQDELHSPYLLKNVEKASERIIQAIRNNERIVVSYDADADGITATTIMLRWLGHYTSNIDYIYGERNDGHGITEQLKTNLNEENNAERLERARNNIAKVKEADLLILIDSSSNDTKVCENIASVGIDIIILDHHEIERPNPHVLMVNPQQEGCVYPNKSISGAGVVFKTIQVMEDELGEIDPFYFMDLVAVGMYADVMRVDVLENRFMIMHGLRNIKNTGLLRILKGAKVDLFKIDSSAIGFSIAPLLNGVARMGSIKLAIDILLEDDDNVCKKLRLQMQKLNDKRKELQKQIVENYMKKVDSSQKVLMVFDEQSSKGFNGIVAQNLSETYKRPVIVGRIHNGTVSGSFRSYNGFKFKSFLQQFGDLGFKIEALGHEGAGGIIISETLLGDLENYIEANMPSLDEREPTIVYDLEFDISEIHEHIRDMEQINLIVGNGFPKVIVKVNNITVEESQCIGKTMETVKIKTFDNLELIKFRVNEDYASELGYFDEISVVGQLQMNEFYNFGLKQKISTPQIMIEDYRVE